MSNEGEFDSIEIWLLSALSIFVSSDSHITCTNVAEHKRNYIWDVLNIGVVESRPLDFVWQTHSSHLYDFTQDGIYLSYKGQNRDVSRWHPCYFVFFVYVSLSFVCIFNGKGSMVHCLPASLILVAQGNVPLTSF